MHTHTYMQTYCKSKSIFLAECSMKRSEQFNTKFLQSLFINHNSLFNPLNKYNHLNKLPLDNPIG